jgi:hypothetical protein
MRLCTSLIFKAKIKQRVVENNSESIAAQSALGGHFVFSIFNFQPLFMNESQHHTLTHIFYFERNA